MFSSRTIVQMHIYSVIYKDLRCKKSAFTFPQGQYYWFIEMLLYLPTDMLTVNQWKVDNLRSFVNVSHVYRVVYNVCVLFKFCEGVNYELCLDICKQILYILWMPGVERRACDGLKRKEIWSDLSLFSFSTAMPMFD